MHSRSHLARSVDAPKYYPAFDYLRICLASIVAFWHSGGQFWIHAADYSVQVFFALSGWLIGGILLRSPPSALPRFYFNRAARIWIPYFVAIALLGFASVIKGPITTKLGEMFYYDVTFTLNIFESHLFPQFSNVIPLNYTGIHFWSICAEEQFYLFAPFLIVILFRVGRTVPFWTIVAVLALFCPYWKNFGAISFGVLASVLNFKFGDWQSKKSVFVSLILAFAAVFLATYVDFIPYRIGAPISAICLVLSLAQTGSQSRVGEFIGGVSYPMYLNHWIGWFVANVLFTKLSLKGTIYSELASVLFALLIAAVLYLCVDRAIKTYRNRYFTVFRGKATAVLGLTLFGIGLAGGVLFAYP